MKTTRSSTRPSRRTLAAAALLLASLPLSGCIIQLDSGTASAPPAPETPSRLKGVWTGDIPQYDEEGKVAGTFRCKLELRDTNTAVLTGFVADPANKVATGTWRASDIDRSELETGAPVKRLATVTVIDDTTMKWESVPTVNGDNPAVPLKVREHLIFTREPVAPVKP